MRDNQYIDPLENNLECSTDFKYPDDNALESDSPEKCLELLNRICNYVIPSRNITLTLISLFYSSGIDLSYVLQCENSESAIAKKLGVPKQTLHTCIVKVRRDFGLIHSTTKRHNVDKNTYANNSRKIKD
jgi:hypothetical protein